jgi:hypothetical protein
MNGNDHLAPEDQPTPDVPPTRGRKGLAAGLAIGLIGGTAAGLVMGVPGLTSASNDVASLVQQTDTTDEAETPATPEPMDESADDAPATHAERLRESLQELVDAGTITAEQADAVAEHLVTQVRERVADGEGRVGGGPFGEHRGRAGGGMFGRGAGVVSEALTDLLGLDAQELREQLRDGSTLADIAEENGVEPQAVIDELVAEYQERLDNAVENGRLEQTEADERLARATERITELVDDGHPAHPDRTADTPAEDTPAEDTPSTSEN